MLYENLPLNVHDQSYLQRVNEKYFLFHNDEAIRVSSINIKIYIYFIFLIYDLFKLFSTNYNKLYIFLTCIHLYINTTISLH